MQLKLFMVPVKNLSIPESEMNSFLRSHRVLAVKKESVLVAILRQAYTLGMKSMGGFSLRRKMLLAAVLFGFFGLAVTTHAAAPVVSNVRSAQRAGTQLVDVDYDLADADSPTLTVSIAVSTNGGASYTLPATSFTGAVGTSMARGTGKRITWNAGVDWPNKFSANVRFRVTASEGAAPSSMALIPAGSFTMGNTFSGEGDSNELPLHTVYVSGFYMDSERGFPHTG